MEEITPQLKGAIESIIFISERPISLSEIQEVIEGLDLETIKSAAEELKNEYGQRNSGIKIVEVAGGFQMVTSPNYASSVKKFYKIKHSEKLTMPSLETLSIIAYKQPVTKVEIELIRGVNVDGVLKSLIEKSLIRIVGRKEVIGRPFVYGTTRNFLEYFGLNSLKELPNIEEFVQTLSQKDTAQITPLQEQEIESLAQGQNNGLTTNENLNESTPQDIPQENNDNNNTIETRLEMDSKNESR